MLKEAKSPRRTCSTLARVNGVSLVDRKWHLGVGMSDAIIDTRSLFM